MANIGKINSRVDYVNKLAKQNEYDIYKDYDRYLDGHPIYVTLVHQNKTLSTDDEGSGMVFSHTGDSTSIVYDRIKHVPLYGVSGDNIEVSLTDFDRMDAQFDSSGIMLPNLVEVLPNDYFIVEYLDRKALFKITNVEFGGIKSNNYYRISFNFDTTDTDIIDGNINNEMTVIDEHLGSDKKMVVTDDTVLDIESLNRIFEEYREMYVETFFHQDSSSFLYEDTYDSFLMYFICKNSIFEVSNNAYNGITPIESVQAIPDFYKYYNSMIYNIVEKKRIPNNLFNNYFRLSKIKDVMTYFYNKTTSYYQVIPKQYNDIAQYYEYLDSNIYDVLKVKDANVLSDYDDKLLEFIVNVIKSYISGEDRELRKYIRNINDFDCFMEYNRSYYILIPIFLFIIDKLIDNI